MSRSLSVTVAATILPVMVAAVFGTRALAAMQGPPNRVLTVVDPAPAPPTMEEIWRRADVVVRGVIDSLVVKRSPTGGALTEYHLRVAETFKGGENAKAGAVLSVAVMGGRLQLDSQIVETINAAGPRFAPRDEVVLFLSFWPAANSYAPSAASFKLQEDTVAVPELLARVSPLEGKKVMARAELITLLRTLAAK